MENTELDVLENNIKALEIEILALEMKYGKLTYGSQKNKIGKEIEQKKNILADNYNELGVFWVNNENLENAKNAFEKSVANNPKDSKKKYNLGLVYANLGKLQIAKEIFEKLLLFEPQNANVWDSLGTIYNRIGNKQKAIEYYEKSLEINPKKNLSWRNLGVVYYDLDKKQKAIEFFEKAIQIDSKNDGLWNDCGNIYSKLGEIPTAINYYEKALEINPKNSIAWGNLGRIYGYENLKENQKAVNYYKKALEISPQSVEFLNNLADLHLKLNELELAKPYIEKARELLAKVTSKETQKIVEETYQEFLEQYQKSLIKSSSENINEFGKENLAFTIKKLCVSNFQSIKSLEIQIPTDAQFVCLLGQNGDGKTSILQALAVGLQGAEGASRVLESYETQIAVEFLENSKKQIHNLYREPNAWRTFAKCSNTVGYGVKRLSKLSDFDVERMLKSNPFYCLLNEKDDEIENIEAWFIKDFWKHKKVTPLAEELRKIIEKILSSITQKVEIVEEEGTFYYLEQGFKVKYDHLSAGSKSVLNLVGDILIRLIAQNKEVSTVENLKGIVLIDEVESHLHPKAQKDLMQKLSEIFPKVQFIVSTHSAICLLGMPENTAFFRVKRDFERGTFVERLTIDVANLLPNQLLTSPLFDMENIFSVNTESIYEVDTGIMYKNKAEKEKQEELRRQILEKYKKV